MPSEMDTGDLGSVQTTELFSPSSTESWAESVVPVADSLAEVPEPDSLAAVSEPSEIPVLPALRFLEDSGVVFQLAPKYLSASDGRAPVLRKCLSVLFTVDTVVSSSEIIFGFDAAGVDVDDISSIQRKTSNRSWIVSFRTTAAKEQALALPFITISGCQVFLGFRTFYCPCESL